MAKVHIIADQENIAAPEEKPMNSPAATASMLPEGFDVDFTAPAFLADPWTPLRVLQQHAPVFWSEKQQAWIVTRYADVKDGLMMDDRLSPDRIVPYFEKYGDEIRKNFPNVYRYTPKWLANMDAPAHTRVRQLFTMAFHKKIVERERLFVRSLVAELLDMAGRRDSFDFVSEIANAIPPRLICHMIGIDLERNREFLECADAAISVALSADLTPESMAQMDRALAYMSEVIVREVESVRAHPRDDLLTALVHARYEEDRLSDDELVATCQLIFAAGVDTTKHMLNQGLVELAARPEVCAFMAADPANVMKVVNETLRFVSLVKGSIRMVRHDFEWHGKQLRKDDLLFLMNGAANHDPDFWDEPFGFKPERDNGNTLAFGFGIHHCVGHLLAKMELAEFFSAAFAQYDVEILPGDRGLIPSYAFRAMSTLPVRFTAKRNP